MTNSSGKREFVSGVHNSDFTQRDRSENDCFRLIRQWREIGGRSRDTSKQQTAVDHLCPVVHLSLNISVYPWGTEKVLFFDSY